MVYRQLCDVILDAYEKYFHSLDHNGDIMPVDANLFGWQTSDEQEPQVPLLSKVVC